MAAMTEALYDALYDEACSDTSEYVVLPTQRDRRSRRPVAVVRVCSDSPLGAQLLLPAVTGTPSIAGLLPIQRDRRARRARRGSARRMTVLAVAFGVALVMWVAIIGGVLALAHAL
jgi:hypothetical protein